MKWYQYSEPDENGEERIIKMSEEQIVVQMRNYHEHYRTQDVSNEELILDFCALHWAFEVKEEQDE
jgi:hypothetical protein